MEERKALDYIAGLFSNNVKLTYVEWQESQKCFALLDNLIKEKENQKPSTDYDGV